MGFVSSRGAAIALVKVCFVVRASIDEFGWLNQDESETGFGSDEGICGDPPEIYDSN